MNDATLALTQKGYRQVQAIGTNPLGAVLYAAQQDDIPVQIAVSSLRVGGWDTENRFAQTAARWQRIQHPAFPRHLTDFTLDTAGDRYFCRVTTAVPGSPLAPGLAEPELRDLAIALMEAVVYLHDQRLVHGSIRPEVVRWNGRQVFLTEVGGWDSPTVTALATTAGFLAPEQYRGEAIPASDLFAVGATLIYAHTGGLLSELPQNDGLLDWAKALPQLSPEMQWWLTELVEPLPENRPRSAEVALKALKNGELRLVAPPPSRRWTVRKTTRALEATCRQDLFDLVIFYPLTVLAVAVFTLGAIARLVPNLASFLPFANFLLGIYLVVWGGTLVLAGGNVADAWSDAWRKLRLSVALALSLGGALFGLWGVAIAQQWPGCSSRTPLDLVRCDFWPQAAPLIYVGVTLWIALAIAGEGPPPQVRYRFEDRKYTVQHRRGGLWGWLGLHRRLKGHNLDIQNLTAMGGGLFLSTKQGRVFQISPKLLWARDRQWLAQELRHFLYIERRDPVL